jgi:hypothetical protein
MPCVGGVQMKRMPLIAAAAFAAVTLAGCGSLGSTPAAGQPSASAGAPSAAATAMCTTHSCIATDLDQSLLGGIDKADAVATKVKCSKTSVKDQGNGTWTAWCDVTYSDGTVSEGTGTVDSSQNEVTFTPSGD